jgi:hypothetical protein
LPLLQTDDDWRCFTTRSEQLVAEKPGVLRVIWNNFHALKKQAVQDDSLRGDLSRLADIIKRNLSPVAGGKLGQAGYSDSDSLNTFFEICGELDIPPDIDLGEAWADCLDDARSWLDDQGVIWEDDGVPGRVAEFLKVLNEFVPSFLERPEVRQQLQEMLDFILERATTEDNSSYESPRDEDEASQRSNGFDDLHKRFEELAALPVWTEEQGKSLKQCAAHFSAEAQSLLDGLPLEPDSDDSGHQRPASEDVNINELFRDL